MEEFSSAAAEAYNLTTILYSSIISTTYFSLKCHNQDEQEEKK
jgi:hypothetical protein